MALKFFSVDTQLKMWIVLPVPSESMLAKLTLSTYMPNTQHHAKYSAFEKTNSSYFDRHIHLTKLFHRISETAFPELLNNFGGMVSSTFQSGVFS